MRIYGAERLCTNNITCNEDNVGIVNVVVGSDGATELAISTDHSKRSR